MSSENSSFSELARHIENEYLENSPFGDCIRREDFTSSYEDTKYYRGGQWITLAYNFHPKVTANEFTKKLWCDEKRLIVENIKTAAGNDGIPIKQPSDYGDISKIVERMRGPTHAIFPTKTGRPKLVHDEVQKVRGVPFSLSSVETRFLNSDMFDFERGIIIDSESVYTVQKRVGDLDVPSQFVSSQVTHFADDDGYVDMYEVKSNSESEFYYRTVFSGLQNISEDHVVMVELPD